MPDGEAKPLIEGICVGCHRLSFITNSVGNSHADWDTLISTMIALPDQQQDTITSYLAEHFPKKADSHPVVIDGPVDVEITEWLLPTLGSRPHDPIEAHDGSLWWTGQFANRLGRIDRATGELKEFPLDVPNSTPHGLDEDADGNIWFTAVAQGYVGKLDPTTGEVTEHYAPEGQRGVRIRRYSRPTARSGSRCSPVTSDASTPSTGEVTAEKTPTDGTYPYGIMVNSKGEPWYVDFRGPRIGQVDPETGKITRARAAECRLAPAPYRADAGRCGLVHGLSARLPGPLRPRDRRTSRNGSHRAVRSRFHTASQRSATCSGTSRPMHGRTFSCASTARPRSFKRSRFPRAAVSCVTWLRRRTAISCWPAARSITSPTSTSRPEPRSGPNRREGARSSALGFWNDVAAGPMVTRRALLAAPLAAALPRVLSLPRSR